MATSVSRRATTLVAVIILLGVCVLASAPAAVAGSVGGYVLGDDGYPVSSVQTRFVVHLEHWETQQMPLPDGTFGTIRICTINRIYAVDVDSGHYYFGNVPPEQYVLRIVDLKGELATEYYADKATLATADLITVTESSSERIDFRLAPAAHITGAVTKPGSKPLANVGVCAMLVDDPGYVEEVRVFTTGADGAYDLGGLPAGTYYVRFLDRSGRYSDQYYDGVFFRGGAVDWTRCTAVSVAEGETVSGIDARMTRAHGPKRGR